MGNPSPRKIMALLLFDENLGWDIQFYIGQIKTLIEFVYSRHIRIQNDNDCLNTNTYDRYILYEIYCLSGDITSFRNKNILVHTSEQNATWYLKQALWLQYVGQHVCGHK